jgi:hypothetical protein
MASLTRRPLAHLGAGVFAALLTLLLAPSSAPAACGDYIVLTGDGSAAPAPHPDTPPGGKAPCSGPSCSRGPATPPLSLPVPPPSERRDPGAVLPSVPGPDTAGHVSAPPEGPAGRPLRHGATVYHPPRPR